MLLSLPDLPPADSGGFAVGALARVPAAALFGFVPRRGEEPRPILIDRTSAAAGAAVRSSVSFREGQRLDRFRGGFAVPVARPRPKRPRLSPVRAGVRLLDLNRRKGTAAVPSPKKFFSRVVTYIPGAVAVRPLHVEGRVLEGPGNIGGAVRPSPAAVPACGSLCQSCRRLDLSGKISAGRGSTDEKPRPIPSRYQRGGSERGYFRGMFCACTPASRCRIWGEFRRFRRDFVLFRTGSAPILRKGGGVLLPRGVRPCRWQPMKEPGRGGGSSVILFDR